MKKIILFLFLSVCAQIIHAQTLTIQGTVIDAGEQPIIGVMVTVDGTQLATVTDYDGNFTLKDVPEGATVTFSFLGMKSQSLRAQPMMNIRLEDDAQMLEDVVAIGYGTAKAKDLTSPIVVVRGEELANTPSTSPMTALQGKVSGVSIVSSGTP